MAAEKRRQAARLDPAVTGEQRELDELAKKGDATLITPPVVTQHAYELWVDQEQVAHYERAADVDATLRDIAAKHIAEAEAEAALSKKDLKGAFRLAGVAGCADGR